MWYQNEETENYFKQVFIRLGHPENRGRFVKFADLIQDIPQVHVTQIWIYLWHGQRIGHRIVPRVFEARPDFFANYEQVEIMLNKEGVKLIEYLEDEEFNSNQKLLYAFL